jgi:surfeit locus 1 family protein
LDISALPVEGRRGFRPGLAQTLGFLALLPALLGLADWQVQRADEKAALIAAWGHASESEPVPIGELPQSALPQRAQAAGQFASERFLLDNRISNGRAGYELLVPLILADGRAVLVDRGWLPLGRDRRDLPNVQIPAGPVRVVGLATPPSPPAFALSDRDAFAEGWPQVVQTAEPARLATRTRYPLMPVLLYPDGSEAARARIAGLTDFPPARHLAYAFQWLALALVLVLLYVAHGLRRATAEGRA